MSETDGETWFSLVVFVLVIGAALGWIWREVGEVLLGPGLSCSGCYFCFLFLHFCRFLEESLPFFGKKNLVGIVVGYYGVFLIKGSWGSLVY